MKIVKRNVHIPIVREDDINIFLDHCYRTRHFNNLLIMAVDDIYKSNKDDKQKKKDYLLFLDPQIFRAILAGQSGGQNKARVDYLLSNYEGWIKKILKAAEGLLPKNLYYVVKSLRTAYKSTFTKIKKGDVANFPKPKKLKNTYSDMSLPIDQERFTFKGSGRLGINLGQGQQIFHINEKALIKCVGDLKNITALEILCKNGRLLFSFIYKKEITTQPCGKVPKYAGMDLGVKNIASIFILDDASDSIILKSDKFIAENSLFNKRLSELKSKQDILKNKLNNIRCDLVKSLLLSGANDTLSDDASYFSERFLAEESEDYSLLKKSHAEASQEISSLFSNRHDWMKDNLHKLSRRVLEILSDQGVSILFTSRNLGKIKPKMGKVNNQKFVCLPIMKFLDYLKLNAAEYGIEIDDSIDEAYTSKSSCFTDESDIVLAQELGKQKRTILERGQKGVSKEEKIKLETIDKQLLHACGGKRSSRSIYKSKDKLGHTKSWLSDLGSALNHIQLGLKGKIDTAWVRKKMFKLCRPMVIKCEGSFLDIGVKAFSNALG